MEEKMNQISIMKILGLVGMLTDELIKIQADGKVTITEGVKLVDKVCMAVDMDFDIPDAMIEIIKVIEERMRDDKQELTVEEAVQFVGSIFEMGKMNAPFAWDDALVEYLKAYNG